MPRRGSFAKRIRSSWCCRSRGACTRCCMSWWSVPGMDERVACPHDDAIVSAPTSPAIVERGVLGDTLIVEALCCDKYIEHLPIERHCLRFARAGVDIAYEAGEGVRACNGPPARNDRALVACGSWRLSVRACCRVREGASSVSYVWLAPNLHPPFSR